LVAAKILRRASEDGAWSNMALDAALAGQAGMDPRDRALATELVYGALTWQRSIDAALALGARGALDQVEPELLAVLRVAVYQLLRLDRVPAHSAVDEAVRSVYALGRGKKPAGFVNGVLRGVLRAREADQLPKPPKLDANPTEHIAQAWSLPGWIARRMVSDFGVADALALAEALAQRPGMTLRAVGQGVDRQALAERLGAALTPLSPAGLLASKRDAALDEALSGAQVVVQDEGSQLVGLLAWPDPGARVLDACAGRGGKSAQLAERLNEAGRLVALELHESKFGPMRKLFERLGGPAPQMVAGDLRAMTTERLGGGFDLVVVDAPCSGLGVLRRHPEARWSREPADLGTLSRLQAELLEAAARLVVPGGSLVYSVCSFASEEGHARAAVFLASNPGWSLDLAGGCPDVPWDRLRPTGAGFLALPHEHRCDGFFMTRLRRVF
jgi:16S rRNA (cytosine967-C5)-methyltransferase